MTDASVAQGDPLLALLVEIATTPAPTGDEGERAELITHHWREAGLDPHTDEVGNVVAYLPASTERGTAGPRLLVACHLDSVFARSVDLSVKQSQERWTGAGLGDNAASLAVLTHWLKTRGDDTHPPLTLVATVGEEGLGDLRGARHAVAELGEGHSFFLALDGYLGSVIDRPVGSKRYEATFKAPGGHSWGDYPSPSATHAAGDAIARLAAVHVPKEPRSSLNVGVIWGGTSINAIAEAAGFNLDLRSVDAGSLEGLKGAALAAIKEAAAVNDVEVSIEKVGDRPTGSVDNRELAEAAVAAYESVGVKHRRSSGSTDANAATKAGLPAISFGVYRGGNAHRVDEWVDPASLEKGVRALRALLKRLA